MILPSPTKKNQVPEEIVERGYETLINSLRSISPLSEETIEHFRDLSQMVLYHPRDIIVGYGVVCNYCLLALRGLVKSTYLKKGVEKIAWFMGAGDVIVALDSWYEQSQSEEQLVAIKETICIAISYNHFELMKKEHRDFLDMVLKLTEYHYALAIKRTKWQQFSSDEKIENLEELYPVLMKEVPSTDLASFLGISRETFSRKRPRRTKEDYQ